MPDGPIPWEDVHAAEDCALGGASGGRRAALCLSGGGIRSASFSVGVIQGLARRGLLPHFDYLSTVSGGGFAGAWLSAWIHRAQAPDRASDPGEVEAARGGSRS